MSSRADCKRKRRLDRFPHVTIVDDVVKPLTEEQKRRFVAYVIDDRPAFKCLEQTRNVIAPPDDVVALPPEVRNKLALMESDHKLMGHCAKLRPITELPGDILTASDRGRVR